jgi:ferredoxin
MLCSTCYVTMTEEQTYDYSADVEQFLVKSWRCGRCEGRIEEILAGPSEGRAPKRMRYAVRQWTEPVGAGVA